ncbi:hypothetical protein ASF61_16940 [Duganella sp. Leaf126]|uniref:hypothetical protein n=1 Tax=Duganella sp. Leaf126 TaxID=1736266 RepID=UPI0006F6EF60|nr:hypothetical protein [Duganella sp. Leaf126]KQQ32020.1 hypothetical protein ASF61_16940 [Duganella sp. Leaf126]
MNARFVPPADDAAAPPVHVPKHQSFSWLVPQLKGNPHAEFIALTMSVCRGAELALKIVQESELDRDHEETGGYFSPSHCDQLKILAIGSLKMLADRAEAEISDLNDVAQRLAARGGN